MSKYEKKIIWDGETKDFELYLDGESVGMARTFAEAEETLNALIAEIDRMVAEEAEPVAA
jgi:hypothetical protein